MPLSRPQWSQIPYKPLDQSRKEIRLLRVRRRDPDGHLEVDLKHFSLQSALYPRFTALSYVWGEPKLRPQPIIVNGKACGVLDSIYPILCLLCDCQTLRRETWFWIDYLCINQSDPSERATQVALMGSLYALAFRTIVWLGEPVPSIVGAVGTLQKIARCRLAYGNRHENYQRLWASITPGQWDALSQWMDLPWFTRVWTLQEFLIPDRLEFHYGEERISKLNWTTAIGAIYEYQSVGRLQQKAYGNQWARNRLLEYTSDDIRLVALMAYVGYYKAKDPRDKIYAMLGLCADVDRLIVGPPDYSRPVDEIYTGLARKFITIHDSLDLICFSALFNDSSDVEDQDIALPSWAPDWR